MQSWITPKPYAVGNEVTGSDGDSYIAVADSNGIDPIADDGSHWQLITQQGEEGATGPAGPAFNPRGIWHGDGVVYAPGDLVRAGSSSYVCVTANTSEVHVDPGSNGDWQVVATDGADGAAPWTAPTVWDGAVPYVIGPPASLVTRTGHTYVAVAPTTGVDPATDDGSHWALIV